MAEDLRPTRKRNEGISMRKISRNRDPMGDHGETGIAQTLLLISTILIAAMGAGMLLQTGGGLFSRGDRVSDDVETSASSKVLMENVILFDDGADQDVDDLYLTIRLAPGSKELDLSSAYVKVQGADFSQGLEYTSNLAGESASYYTCENAAASDGGSGDSGIVVDPDRKFTLEHPIMTAGTILQIHIDIAAVHAAGLSPGDKVDVWIQTASSAPGYIQFTVPDPLVDEFLILK